MKKMILLWVVAILVVGCGRKAAPVPWESIVPKRIVDLEAVSREGRLLLQWTAPIPFSAVMKKKLYNISQAE
jgi:hypothetical protein